MPLFSFRKRLRHSSETVKRLLMISLGLGVLCVGLVTYNIQNNRADNDAEVLGAEDRIIQTSEYAPVNLNPLPNQQDPESTVDAGRTTPTEVLVSGDYSLEGEACRADVSGTTCELLYQGSPVLTLKNCVGEGNPLCNFYRYSLGRATDTNVYVFQSYEDSAATLTDVLEYTQGATEATLLDTVLYEELGAYRAAGTFDLELEPNTLTGEVEANNETYLDTLNQYR